MKTILLILLLILILDALAAAPLPPVPVKGGRLLTQRLSSSVNPPHTNILLTVSLPLSWTFQSTTDLVTWTSFETDAVPALTISVPATNAHQCFRVVTANNISGATVFTNAP